MAMSMVNPRLSIELVPRTAWWSNVRSNVSARDWEACKKLSRAQSSGRCEICGGRGKRWATECHERWFYEEEEYRDTYVPYGTRIRRTQTLIGLIALCPDCHACKHIGRSIAVGKGEQAIMHLSKVNGWDAPTCEQYIRDAFHRWEVMSEREWKLDISYLGMLGIKVPDVIDREKAHEQ
jgi:hypothetical protein